MKKVVLCCVVPALVAAGPISKFDSKPALADYVSAAKMEDIERCLIDMQGWLAPNVYAQPDRPDDVTMLWISGGDAAGKAAARVQLHRVSGGTHVVSWMPAKQALDCAPRS
jgi:hypothetical protein